MVLIELQYDTVNHSFAAKDLKASVEDHELYLATISPSGLEVDIEHLDLRI